MYIEGSITKGEDDKPKAGFHMFSLPKDLSDWNNDLRITITLSGERLLEQCSV